MKKALIIGGECLSLMKFRGELLKSFKAQHYEVYACAGGKSKQATKWFKDIGIIFVPIQFRRTGLNPFSDLLFFLKLVKTIKKINPDIILTYTIKPVIYGLLASHICKVKNCYALITGLGYSFMPSMKLKQRLVKIIVLILYKFSLSKAKSIFFQNEDDLNLFKDKKIISDKAHSIRVNGSGVDLDYYEFKPLQLLNNNINFLLIARLLKDKGIYEYVEAAKIVKKTFPEKKISFSLLGSFDINPTAIPSEQVYRWHDDGLINYLGETEDVRPYIEKCSVYILPSYREGMPRSVLEAMSIGRAIITTNVPGCKETVIPGKNGYLVEMQSSKELAFAMTKIINNKNLIEKMGLFSRKLATERFNVHNINSIMLKEMGVRS